MEILRKARRPLRREFETQLEELKVLLKETPLNIDVINVKYKLFNETFEKLQSFESKIMDQMIKEQMSEADEDKEWDDIRDEKLRGETLRQLKEKLLPSAYSEPGGATASISDGEVKVRNFKLPNVQLKKFSGELKDWLAFWAQFQKIHDDPHMSGSDKYWYLLQSLEPNTDAYEIAAGYPGSNENYEIVIESLKRQYGNEDLLLQVYIREILSLVISNVNAKEKLPMKGLFLKLDSHLRALKTLNLQKADPATWLFPLVESCLPEQILYNWQRSPLSSHDGSKDDPPKTRLDLLMTFVEREVEIRQRIDITKNFASQQREANDKRIINKEKKTERRAAVPTLSSFHIGEKVCVFCEKSNHVSADCFRAKKMSYEDKLSILREKGLCFRCTGKHRGVNCKTNNVICQVCKKGHLTVLCKGVNGGREKRKLVNEIDTQPSKKSNLDLEVIPRASNSNVEISSDVALQTLKVKVIVGNKSLILRSFIDTGSQRSYILKSTAARLELKPCGLERVVHSTFGDMRTSPIVHHKYNIQLCSTNTDFTTTVEIRDNNQICGRLPSIPDKYPEIMNELKQKNVKLSDTCHGNEEIQLLIGADVYPMIITDEIQKLDCGAVAVRTMLGWTLLGKMPAADIETSMSNAVLNMTIHDASISKLWDLDVIGIEDPIRGEAEKVRKEIETKEFLKNITRMGDGRYSVKLPWKNSVDFLPSNRPIAFKRLQNASNKLMEKGLFLSYNQIFIDWLKEGFIEEVVHDDNLVKVHYLPHRPVIKESLTTPVRPVFDASCRVGKFPSLNDCLFTGENYVKAIPDLIQRFREKKIAFVSDIRKAFQMIGVHPEDRDFMRFLWWQNTSMDKVVEYRHARVMFGATCSPFILGAVIYIHLSQAPAESKLLADKLLSSFYVDNCVSSEHTVEEYEKFKRESIKIMKEAAMDLRMWLSNVDAFEDETTHVVSVLGLQWDRNNDELYVNLKNVSIPQKITKRSVLSTVQKIFDPIGFLAPSLVPMKLLLQRAWIQKLKWDETLPEEERKLFLKWFGEIQNLQNIRIPRLSTAGVEEKEKWSLHVFTDASKSAYSATVYLRVEADHAVKVQLLSAKSRIAPIKPLTIPKLELMGCLLGKRLLESVKNALSITEVPVIYWSDSMTALAWIRRESEQWGTFVANRVREIRKTTNTNEWRHIPGSQNPADLPSRGCLPSKLLQLRWWEGPSFLYEDNQLWPNQDEEVNESEVLAELRKTSIVTTVVTSTVLDEIENTSSFSRKVRVIGWIRRFLFNKFQRNSALRKFGPLSKIELNQAEQALIRQIQFKAFPLHERKQLTGLEVLQDENGLLRVKTRLTYRDDPVNFKFPMLLPRKCKIVESLIQELHLAYCHAGIGFLVSKLREKYWILKARHTVRGVILKCARCRRYSSKPAIPEPAPLPLDRIGNAEVFDVVGVDLAGPLILKNGKKVWMVIFTCGVYRAVHFDLVKSISTKAFIACLERFVEKYKRPSVIYSDNGSNFKGADNYFRQLNWEEIKKCEGLSRITWKFNPVTSSWWGGWWERLIGVAKNLLKRSVGKRSLNFNELKSILSSVAEVMNGRPLTYVSEDPKELEPLTPAMFLHPFGSVSFPESNLSESEKLRIRYKYLATLKRELRDRFRKEYLSMLVNRNPKKASRALKVGEIVFVGCDNLKRIDWPLGRIIELIPGHDGICRLAKLKTEKGEIVRSFQRLYPLEVDQETEVEKNLRENMIVTRSGRRVVKPVRFL